MASPLAKQICEAVSYVYKTMAGIGFVAVILMLFVVITGGEDEK